MLILWYRLKNWIDIIVGLLETELDIIAMKIRLFLKKCIVQLAWTIKALSYFYLS